MSKTSRPVLEWVKWVDPLGRHKTRPEWESETTYEKSSYEDDDKNDIEFSLMGKSVPMIVMTRDGPIPLKPYSNVADAFNWWVLHSGFPITSEMKNALDEVHGVEILDPVTSYRIRFALARMYDEEEVKESVNQVLSDLWKNTYHLKDGSV